MRDNKFLKVLIVMLVVVFVVHQAYSSFYKPIKTVSAEFHEVVDGLNVTASVIRTEHLITNDTAGSLHFTVADGERTAKDGVIARIYDNASASITLSRISELERQIADIEQMQGYNDKAAADLDLANAKLSTAVNEYVLSCAGGNFDKAAECEDEVISCINRRSLITGEQTDFSERLNALNTELSSLKAALPAEKGRIVADTSGYFISSADGYEQVYTCESPESITPEFLAETKPSDTPHNVIGKIVSDYEWYIAAPVTLDQSLNYKEGDRVTLKTKLKSSPELSVTVSRVNLSQSEDTAVVVFACSDMNSELSALRTVSVTIVSKSYEGLQLPKKALRVVEEQTGVYVVSGMSLKFVPVEVIYSTKDNEYIICKQEKSNENVLRLYDEVVVKGRKLYDGKIVG